MLIWDLVLVVLDHVVCLAAPVLGAVTDDLQHVVCCLSLVHLWCKSCPQLFDRVAPETWQACVQHQRHEGHDSLSVRPTTNEMSDIVGSL